MNCRAFSKNPRTRGRSHHWNCQITQQSKISGTQLSHWNSRRCFTALFDLDHCVSLIILFLWKWLNSEWISTGTSSSTNRTADEMPVNRARLIGKLVSDLGLSGLTENGGTHCSDTILNQVACDVLSNQPTNSTHARTNKAKCLQNFVWPWMAWAYQRYYPCYGGYGDVCLLACHWLKLVVGQLFYILNE